MVAADAGMVQDQIVRIRAPDIDGGVSDFEDLSLPFFISDDKSGHEIPIAASDVFAEVPRRSYAMLSIRVADFHTNFDTQTLTLDRAALLVGPALRN